MKVEIKVYKIFDPDLYAMSAYGIKITNLMKEALEHYVRGEYVHFHIPKSLIYDFSLKKRSVHLAMDITDPESIAFLKKNIKPRYRTAFLKSLLRGSFTTPQLGAFLSNEASNRNDTKMIKMTEFETLPNLKELTVSQKPRRIYDAPVKTEDKEEEQQELIDNLKENQSSENVAENSQTTHKQPSKVPDKKEPTKVIQEKHPQQEQRASNASQEQQPQNHEQGSRKNKKKKKKKLQTQPTQPLEDKQTKPTKPLEDKFGITVNPTKQENTPPAPSEPEYEEFKLEEEKDPQEHEEQGLVLEDVNVVEDNGDEEETFRGFDSMINKY